MEESGYGVRVVLDSCVVIILAHYVRTVLIQPSNEKHGRPHSPVVRSW